MNDGRLKITIVVGNPRVQSRTRLVAEELVQQLFGRSAANLEVVELAEHQQELFQWPSTPMDELSGRVADSDLIVFATPTYKASYTGLLKSFLDRYPANGLRGRTAICLMTGGGEGHSLAPSTTLVPLLLELGTSVLGGGIYFNIQNYDQLQARISEIAVELIDALRRSARLLSAAEQAS